MRNNVGRAGSVAHGTYPQPPPRGGGGSDVPPSLWEGGQGGRSPLPASRLGFTFIELTIVFAIIGILAAILFPVFAKAQRKALQTNCMTNLQNIGAALRMYAADHYGRLPPTDNNMDPLVPKYLAEPDVFLCPSVKESRVIAYPPKLPGQQRALWQSDYVYRGGLCDDDSPEHVVAADSVSDRHNDMANYLWTSGRTKAMKPEGSYRWEGAEPVQWKSEIEAITALRKAKGDEKPKPPEPPPNPEDEGI